MPSSSEPINLNTSLKILYYVSSIILIIPYKLQTFWKYNRIEFSRSVTILISLNMIIILGSHHIFAIDFIQADAVTGTLTMIVGISMLYMKPIMLLIDIIANFINRHRLIACLNRLQHIDDQLIGEGIPINLWILRQRSIVLIITIAIFCAYFLIYNITEVESPTLEDFFRYINDLLISLMNSVSKIWFVTLLFCLRQKFQLINKYMEEVHNAIYANRNEANQVIDDKDLVTIRHAGYLHREIMTKRKVNRVQVIEKGTEVKRKWTDVIRILPGKDNDHLINSQIKPLDIFTTRNNQISVNHDVLDSKLMDLCRIHYELCDVGQTISRMFSVQMLLLMAYGFMTVTSLIYFSFCSRYGQPIPYLLRSTKSLWFSGFSILYVVVKCVYVIMLSWTTKIHCLKTGIYLHKVANAVDESDCYHMINQLSLNVLNHKLTFTACGFFHLDMTTLYAITGAITTYLVILIQLNSAAQSRGQTIANDTMNATIAPATTTMMSHILTTLKI